MKTIYEKTHTLNLSGLVVIVVIVGIILIISLAITDDPNGVTATEGYYTLVDMDITAYCVCEKCCGIWATTGVNELGQRITASGVPAEGFIVAAPAKYPFGTIMDIPGYGVVPVQDRGGAITGNKIDLLFSNHQKALEWGRQFLTVKVYKARMESVK